jgi:hypothetical protein
MNTLGMNIPHVLQLRTADKLTETYFISWTHNRHVTYWAGNLYHVLYSEGNVTADNIFQLPTYPLFNVEYIIDMFPVFVQVYCTLYLMSRLLSFLSTVELHCLNTT